MALLTFNPLPCLSSSSSSSSSVSSCSTSFPMAVLPISRIWVKAVHDHPSKCLIGTQFVPIKKRTVMTVKASSASTDGDPQLPAESKKEDLPVGQLPLESKMQQIAEQKMRMKLAKKIRLRRKRLVRKRKMRKKGRWPPSKMKKLKNAKENGGLSAASDSEEVDSFLRDLWVTKADIWEDIWLMCKLYVCIRYYSDLSVE